MSSALAKLTRGEGDKVDLSEVMCPICLCILIEPVSMPCQHVLCMPCFKSNVYQSSLSCPICRSRISNWCRQATKSNSLVCHKLWKFLQGSFTIRVESRLAGIDDTDAEELFPCLPTHQFAQEGDIRSEFEAELEKQRQEAEERKQEEEEKSRDLIRRLEQEEQEQLHSQYLANLQDQKLAERLENTPSPGKENRFVPNRRKVVGPLDAFITGSAGTPPPATTKVSSSSSQLTLRPNHSSPFTKPHQRPGKSPTTTTTPRGLASSSSNTTTTTTTTTRGERCNSAESTGSTNSIDSELNHFRPIRSAPKSPPKKLADGSVVEPRLVRAKPMLFSSRNISRYLALDTEVTEVGEEEEEGGDSQESESLLSREQLEDSPVQPDVASTSSSSTSTAPSSYPRTNGGQTGDSPGVSQEAAVEDGANNTPGDYIDTQSLTEILSQEGEEYDPALVEEQKRIESMFAQEKRDAEMAKSLQLEMDKDTRSVDRRKGSVDEYKLRGKTPSSSTPATTSRHTSSSQKRKASNPPSTPRAGSAKKRGRQMSLLESFQKTSSTSSTPPNNNGSSTPPDNNTTTPPQRETGDRVNLPDSEEF